MWCAQVRRSVLFTGASGVGKSAVVMDTLTRMAPDHNIMGVVLNCSAQTSSTATQVTMGRGVKPIYKYIHGTRCI